MTYEELVEQVRNATRKMRASKGVGHVAYQFNVEGEAEGAFYLEISDGKIIVEPYEYYDRDMIVFTTAQVILQMLEGEMEPMAAYANGMLRVQGDIQALKMLPFGCECRRTNKSKTNK